MRNAFKKKNYIDLDNSDEYIHDYFGSKEEAYNYATDESVVLEMNGRTIVSREVSGYALDNGDYIVLDPSDNLANKSFNNVIESGYNLGKLSVKFNSVWYRVKSHFHIHPSSLSFSSGIGVSAADLGLMNGQFKNIKMNILYRGNEWLLSRGSQYNKDGYSYSLTNLGSW